MKQTATYSTILWMYWTSANQHATPFRIHIHFYTVNNTAMEAECVCVEGLGLDHLPSLCPSSCRNIKTPPPPQIARDCFRLRSPKNPWQTSQKTGPIKCSCGILEQNSLSLSPAECSTVKMWGQQCNCHVSSAEENKCEIVHAVNRELVLYRQREDKRRGEGNGWAVVPCKIMNGQTTDIKTLSGEWR
jgi:hypothetical protein